MGGGGCHANFQTVILYLKHFQGMYLKVVIFKSGLGVSVHENANILGTMQDMKISKLALCRGTLLLFFHIKSLVNKA